MPEPGPFTTALLILLVIMIFNLIIFVHELGHFWAAKWRGLKIDRFQIWFGKPIWSKYINGVQYGLGWIPAGGFVALPQMAPMEAIEGENSGRDEPLPSISPLDKIIVAFAGPLFSFLLALAAAAVITVIGKPVELIPTTTIGEVFEGSPAAQAGLYRGDTILAIDDQPVFVWAGDGEIDSVTTRIATGREDKVRFRIDRPGAGEMTIASGFEIPESKWWQRRAMRQVGIAPIGDGVVFKPAPAENGPAELAGMREGDKVLKINDAVVETSGEAVKILLENGPAAVTFDVLRTLKDGQTREMSFVVTPQKPLNGAEDTDRYMVGGLFDDSPVIEEKWLHPSPWQQAVDTLRTMWITITSVASPKSSIGIQHLSGPVGIGKIQYFSLLMEHPLHRILGFMVLININLAILNLLPFPVLDGGHITIAAMEAIARRPVNVKFLEVLQLTFVFLLFGIMLYVTTKDIPDNFGLDARETPEKMVFPAPGGG